MMQEVLANASLVFWPCLALVVFFSFMVGVLFWVYRPGSAQTYKQIARKALDR